MKPTLWTIINLILHVSILLMSFAILGIISDQLVIQNGEWRVCLLQSDKSYKSLDAFKSFGNCATTQAFSSLTGIISIIFLFSISIKLIHQKTPNFSITLFLIILAASFAFITMIIYNIGYNEYNLRELGKRVELINDGRQLSIANFMFCVASMFCFIADYYRFLA